MVGVLPKAAPACRSIPPDARLTFEMELLDIN